MRLDEQTRPDFPILRRVVNGQETWLIYGIEGELVAEYAYAGAAPAVTATQKEYGLDEKHTAAFGRNCLVARRLLERGVRFVQVWSGAGGASGNSHTLDEWYEPHDRDKGLKRGLLVVLGMARKI